MATTQSLLTKVESAIENLLDAIDDDAVQEYSIGNRTYKRAEFDKTLSVLFSQRNSLKKQIARASRSPVRVAKLGRSRATDR